MTRAEIELVEKLAEACWARDEPRALQVLMTLLKSELDESMQHLRTALTKGRGS